MSHLKFLTNYSSEAFIQWLLDPMNEFAGIFKVIANSSKITFSAESEPFMPLSETTPMVAEDEIDDEESPIDKSSETKQQIVERLHMYYSNLILQKNRHVISTPLRVIEQN